MVEKKSKKSSKKSKDIEENGTPEIVNTEVETTEVPKRKRRPRTRSQSEKNESDVELEVKEEGDFSNFNISKKTIKKLKANGVDHLFPVQTATFKAANEGYDVIVQARTGTGKTLAFCLPILEQLRVLEDEICTGNQRSPVILTLAPTRELAIQIYKEFEKYKSKKMNVSCFYGGSPYDKQENELWNGIDILVGTPGRILDHMHRGALKMDKIKHVILDEADRMMDMGFQESLDEILSSSYTQDKKPQTLLFSATVPAWLKNTAKKYMGAETKTFDLIGTSVNKGSTTVEHKAIKCSYWERAATIKDIIQVYSGKHGKTIVFTATKQEANELALNSVINMDSQVLHGDIPQKQREITLQGFRNSKFNCLIATDVAARGLDIPEIDLVIQTEPPKDVESYIHRAGRTGRAGRNGVCIIFYKPGQEYGVAAVEHKAGVNFIRIGAPQQADLIKSSASDSVRALEQVKEDVLEYFLPSAKELIETRGAEKALAAALAYISGTTEIISRSLISSQSGYVTYLMKQNWELRGTSLIWGSLKRQLPLDFTGKIRGMRLTKDKLGCVFDVPSDQLAVLEEHWKGDKYATLEKLTELPELLEGVTESPMGNGNTNFNNNSYGGNRNNNFGNRNNSYGNNRNNGFNNRKRPFTNNNQSYAKKQKQW